MWVDIGQATGRKSNGKTKCRAGDGTGVENLSYNEALSRVTSGIEPETPQFA